MFNRPYGTQKYLRFIPSNLLLGYCQSLLTELENFRIALLTIAYCLR
jgi:hypothetical protein